MSEQSGVFLRLQQKTVLHQQIKKVYSERIFLTYFLISDIVQQVTDRKLKAVFFKNTYELVKQVSIINGISTWIF